MRSANQWWNRFSLLLGLTKHTKPFTPRRVYPEETFCGLVDRESKRSERSGHLCRILLIYRAGAQGVLVPMEPEISIKAISLLSMSLRTTDYIGWYREAYILGVLVTMFQPDSVVDGCSNLKIRLVDNLHGVLAFSDHHPLRIGVLEQLELTALNTSNRLDSFLGFKD